MRARLRHFVFPATVEYMYIIMYKEKFCPVKNWSKTCCSVESQSKSGVACLGHEVRVSHRGHEEWKGQTLGFQKWTIT